MRTNKNLLGVVCCILGCLPAAGTFSIHHPRFWNLVALALAALGLISVGVLLIAKRGSSFSRQTDAWLSACIMASLLLTAVTLYDLRQHTKSASQLIQDDLRMIDAATKHP